MEGRLRVAGRGALVLAWSLALAACGASEGASPESIGPEEGFIVLLEVPSEMSLGERVSLRLVVRNTSAEPLLLYLAGQESTGFAGSLDFVVSLPGGPELWRWSDGGESEAILSLINLDPGEELVLTGEWDQRDAQGNSVGPGEYVVRGFFMEGEWPDKRTHETEPRTLTIFP
jgi:hypothetical protein